MNVIGIKIFLIFATSLLLTTTIMPAVLRFAGAYGLFDQPDNRRVHSTPTPRLGGVAMLLGFFLSLLILFPSQLFSPQMWGIFGPSLVLFLTGLYDDLKPLKPLLRLIIQILSASVAVYVCDLSIFQIVISSENVVPIPLWLGAIVSIFTIVGSINAINMIDGLDGLAGGVVLIGITFLSYGHFLITNDAQLLLLTSIPLIGTLLGFLRYNSHPARIFMGDGGSTWLGFMSGVLMLIVLTKSSVHFNGSTWVWKHILHHQNLVAESNVLPSLGVLTCFAMPIFDTASVIIQRLLSGNSPMMPDKRHFHHTLLRLGLSQTQSVTAIYFFCLIAGLAGLTPVIFTKYNFIVLPYIVFGIIISVFVASARLKTQPFKGIQPETIQPQTSQKHSTLKKYLISFLERINKLVIYIIMLGIPLFSGNIDSNLGTAATGAVFMVIFTRYIKAKPTDLFNTIALCIAATLMLISNNMNPISVQFQGKLFNIQIIYNSLFIWLTISNFLIFVITFRKKYLILSPSDFLILIFPLLVLLIPEPYRSQYKLDTIALRCIILFTSLQFLIRRHPSVLNKLRTIIIISLILVSLIGALGMRIVY